MARYYIKERNCLHSVLCITYLICLLLFTLWLSSLSQLYEEGSLQEINCRRLEGSSDWGCNATYTITERNMSVTLSCDHIRIPPPEKQQINVDLKKVDPVDGQLLLAGVGVVLVPLLVVVGVTILIYYLECKEMLFRLEKGPYSTKLVLTGMPPPTFEEAFVLQSEKTGQGTIYYLGVDSENFTCGASSELSLNKNTSLPGYVTPLLSNKVEPDLPEEKQ